ncbi:MAG: hypothetical protein NT151_05670 [Acidobacteria bacterium]|nr:hypothetical protein [Acidobacteriota bacterium]
MRVGFLALVTPRQFITVMPWTMYGDMSEEDLGEMYENLRTAEPVTNAVDKFLRPRPVWAIQSMSHNAWNL